MPNNTMKERGREWEERCKLEVFDFSAAAAPKGVKRERAFVEGEIRSHSSGLGGLRKQSLSFALSFGVSSVSSYQA